MVSRKFELSEIGSLSSVKDLDYNEALIHQIMVSEMSNFRQGTKAQKTRSEVSGGGRKPWKQKGSGRARAGSIRSPIWRGGGKSFAAGVLNFKKKINKKMFRGAMLSALASLIKEDRLIVVDTFDLGKISTKDANLNLKSLIGGSSGTLVFSEDQEQAGLSYRNILRTDCYSQEELSVYSLVKNDFVVFDENSINALLDRLVV